ncbi:bifunctional protein-serine/threonine kinase/phosphatase [Balneatrix alpica]|uniref:bifunctional protein-serine/threonine kinase/phosphatase n=1 Tax=Balneatrix alpica TaxID=75684 RepID=UPI00273A245D|nr:bifunctional protein-serine/threonine kinase/phosphatase [Balneatrix alpica]
MSLSLEVHFGGYSSAGRKAENQDAFAARLAEPVSRDFKGAVAVIADGVSSCARAMEASQTSVTSFLHDYFSTPDAWGVKKSVVKVLESLNSWLHQQGRAALPDPMLTTFSALVLKSQSAHLFHVGDTRIQLLRDGLLECLTEDHHLQEGGRSYLSRALGGSAHLQVDYRTVEVNSGDIFVLSCDGVHEWVSPSHIQAVAANNALSLEQRARQLVDLAFASGSDDNLSCLLVEVVSLPQASLDEVHRQLTELPIPPVLEVGQKLDGYRVKEVLFNGTRSHLYLVEDEESGLRCTLKAPSVNFRDDPVYLDGFIREEWVGKRIQHPNVMRVLSSPRAKTGLYYLSEHIEGQTLREWMHDHPDPSLAEVRQLTGQIIKALRAFQRLDMVHQDLKPENLMLTPQGQIKVIDFGTVRVAGVAESVSPLDRTLPQGSVNYVAPEYLLGGQPSFKADLFSLAVIVYEMLCGSLPFKQTADPYASPRHFSAWKYQPIRHKRSEIPPWVEACLHKALMPNPKWRYEALSEFEQDLQVPNRALEARFEQAPLIERNPLGFWQLSCGLLVAAQIAQWLYWWAQG